ncbi:MAG TPA: hypothetical protein ENH94_02615, partial [Phycisphaerales bacterium]|nr:hypothetical protein [Phycisphaerales bacterium]
GKTVDLISIFEGIAAFNAGNIGEDELKELECSGCPGEGSCSEYIPCRRNGGLVPWFQRNRR